MTGAGTRASVVGNTIWRRRTANAVAVTIALVVVFPIYWMALSALKPEGEIRSQHPVPWTSEPTLSHFGRVLGAEQFARYFLNSAIVALTVVVLSAVISFLAATALTRFRFRGRTTVMVMFLIAQMVPVEALAIPLFFQMRDLGRIVPGVGLNTLGSLIVTQLAFALPLTIWMLRGFVAAIPKEVEEAALIDGASRSRILWQILFPLAAPGLVATSVFSFIVAWNDFIFAKTFIISATENQTLPLALLVFFKPDQDDWGGIMAASTLMTVPVLVFFILVRRRLVAGLGGALKE